MKYPSKFYSMFIGLGADTLFNISKSKLDGIDIEKEYDLIQQKKSRLSRQMRDLVVFRYNKIKKSGEK